MATLSSWDRILGIHVDLIKLSLPAGSLACVQIYANDVFKKKVCLIYLKDEAERVEGQVDLLQQLQRQVVKDVLLHIYWLPSRGGGIFGRFSQIEKYLQLWRQSNQS